MRKKILILSLVCAFVIFFPFPVEASAFGYLDVTLASDGATWEECTLGDAAADAVRETCLTDFAVVGGGLLGYSLIYGDVEEEDLDNSFPEDVLICTVTLTPAELTEILEVLLSHSSSDGGSTLNQEESAFDGFPQISGFSMTYDVSNPIGSRIQEISFNDGTELSLDDNNTKLTLAADERLFDGSYGVSLSGFKYSETTLKQAFSSYLKSGVTFSELKSDRIKTKGLGGTPLISYVPVTFLVIAAVLIGTFRYLGKRRNRKFYTFDPY